MDGRNGNAFPRGVGTMAVHEARRAIREGGFGEPTALIVIGSHGIVMERLPDGPGSADVADALYEHVSEDRRGRSDISGDKARRILEFARDHDGMRVAVVGDRQAASAVAAGILQDAGKDPDREYEEISAGILDAMIDAAEEMAGRREALSVPGSIDLEFMDLDDVRERLEDESMEPCAVIGAGSRRLDGYHDRTGYDDGADLAEGYHVGGMDPARIRGALRAAARSAGKRPVIVAAGREDYALGAAVAAGIAEAAGIDPPDLPCAPDARALALVREAAAGGAIMPVPDAVPRPPEACGVVRNAQVREKIVDGVSRTFASARFVRDGKAVWGHFFADGGNVSSGNVRTDAAGRKLADVRVSGAADVYFGKYEDGSVPVPADDLEVMREAVADFDRKIAGRALPDAPSLDGRGHGGHGGLGD